MSKPKTYIPKTIGTSTERDIRDRFGDVINVRDFGAKGDGVTDDTDAIQAAFDCGRSGKIIFPNGTYIVSTPLILRNRSREYTLDGDVYSTQWPHVDLCGSCIAWHGADNTSPVFIISANNGLLENGQILGAPKNATGDSHRAKHCVKITSEYGSPFAFRIDNIQLNGYTQSGLIIGDEDHRGSYGCQISNVYITANNSIGDWENNGPAGVELWGADCKFSNVTTQRNKRHVWLHTSGHQFVNCHFVSTTKDRTANTTGMPETAGIWYSLANTTAWYMNTFSGCYFDNVKYVIYNDESHYTQTQLTGCFYFNAGTVMAESVTSCDVYLVGGATSSGSAIHVTNFAIQPSTRCRFISGIECSTNYAQFCEEDYVRNIYSNANTACPWSAQYKIPSGRNVQVLRANTSYAINAGDTRCIGGVMVRELMYADFTVKLVDRYYQSLEAHFTRTSTGWEVDHKDGQIKISVSPTLQIHEPIQITIRGTSMYFIPICLKNETDSAMNRELSGTIESDIKQCGLYLCEANTNLSLTNLASKGITISSTPSVKVKTIGTLFKTIQHAAGVDDTTTASSLNTYITTGVYPVYCTSSTTGAPPTVGYGFLEVFGLPSHTNVSSNPFVMQRWTTISETPRTYVRRLAGEGQSVISDWREL